MPKTIKLRKGADIRLVGESQKKVINLAQSAVYAVKPTDFHGIIPKVVVKKGSEVKAGSTIFFSKTNERIKFASPVSGEVVDVVRGDKRKVLEIHILADKTISYEDFGPLNLSAPSSELREKVLAAGLWPLINQRPFDVIANPDSSPKAVFISGFDSSSLGVDYDFALQSKGKELQAGIDLLTKMGSQVYVGLRSSQSGVLKSLQNVNINYFDGPHPAGNVGVQIHHIAPVNKGENVWTVNVADVAILGHFALTGQVKLERTISIAGSKVNEPKFATVFVGAKIEDIVKGVGGIGDGDVRFISGSIMTGATVSKDGFLGYQANALNVLPEGNEHQFLGWLAPNFHKFSKSRSYFSWLMPNKAYNLDTNMNGEERAFVVSGQYEDVLPMDVLPVQLLKSIMTSDIEAMEKLGIYEVAAEDFALCEVVCTSKIPVQQTIRKGLDMAYKELA